MTRYINSDALIAALQEEIAFESTMYTKEQNKYFDMGLKCALRNVKAQPTADVVPRAEVAREIFEEIEKILDRIYNAYVFDSNDYSDDDVAIECAMNYGTDISLAIDELKKKYTEGGDEG